MAAAVIDIIVEIGSLWERELVVTKGGNPFDLTGYDLSLMIREQESDVAPLVSLTSPTDLTIASNVVGITIKPTESAGITAKTGWWDIKAAVPGQPETAVRLARGRVTFSGEITHA